MTFCWRWWKMPGEECREGEMGFYCIVLDCTTLGMRTSKPAVAGCLGGSRKWFWPAAVGEACSVVWLVDSKLICSLPYSQGIVIPCLRLNFFKISKLALRGREGRHVFYTSVKSWLSEQVNIYIDFTRPLNHDYQRERERERECVCLYQNNVSIFYMWCKAKNSKYNKIMSKIY